MVPYKRIASIPLGLIILLSAFVFTALSPAQEREPSRFEASVRLVEVTLQAQDRAGRHVTDLKPDELKLFAGGRERELRFFHLQQFALERFAELQPLGVEYREFEPVEQPEPRYFVIFMHQMQFEFGFFQLARAAAREFIEQRMLPTDRVSLICFDKYVDLEIDFTGDKQVLLEALDGLQFKFRNIDMIDRYYSFLAQLARRYAELPHKVCIILVAAGMFGVRGQGGYGDYHRAVEALQDADVRVYGLDARGLSFKEPGASVASLPVGIVDLVKQGANLGLYSGPTGGKTFRYHNDLLSLFERIDYEMSAYYVLGFHLDEEEDATSPLNVEIECSRQGVNLRYKKRIKPTGKTAQDRSVPGN